MPPRASLKSFLTTAKTALLAPPAQRPKPFTFVVGNESADLDSLCSALLLAYFRTYSPIPTTTTTPNLHIPLSNLPRADLALRPELAAVLSPAGLTPSDLITLSDLPNTALEETRWLLVDHNVLTGELGRRFGGAAAAVCKGVWEGMAREDCEDGVSGEECDDQIARVALAAVLVDTTCLESRDKTTEWDVKAVEIAEGRLMKGRGYDRRGYFDELTELKEQIVGMSYRDVLRKDYKRWEEGRLAVGMSTVVRGFEYLLEEVGDKSKDAFMEALRNWAREQKLDLVAVMTVSKPDGVFTRELLVWALNEDAVKAARQFVKKSGETLKLETWNDGELDASSEKAGEWRMCWWQKGVEHSRKQVAPMLREAMKESAKL